MKLSIKFNSKSTSSQIAKSIQLANELGGQPLTANNKLMLVEGDHTSKNMIKLLGQVSSLAKTEVSFDHQNIDSPNELYNILSCIRQSYCDGHCVAGDQLFNILFCELGITERISYHPGIDEYYLKKLYQEAPQIIVSENRNEITVNINLLITAYEKSMQDVKKACVKFNAQTIISKLNTLQSLVTLKKDTFENIYLNDETDDDNSNDDDFTINTQNTKLQSTLSTDQIREISIIFADEMEIRIRKILNEIELLKK